MAFDFDGEKYKKASSHQKEVWGENADRYFSDDESMVKWIDQPSIFPFLKYVAPKDKDQFRDIEVKQMIEATGQPDGTCFETFRRVNLFAKKDQ